MAVEDNFPIVGIGASAGGVEAMEGFFRDMPLDIGMAFVVVTHMPRTHITALSEIIGRYTELPVANAQDKEKIEPNRVYVCPSDHIAMIGDGHLVLQVRTSEVQRKPIDVFLSSLAEARGESAVGVILSGGGSDGSLGIKAIKERGGLTIAQGVDGTAPRQSSMPDTAIATGFIDLVLPVEAMAGRLAQFSEGLMHLGQLTEETEDDGEPADMAEVRQTIARILQNQIGHDFSGYKEKTFVRRVRRRMQIAQVDDFGAYIQRLRKDPEEVTLLFRDLLIGVTNFFRDKDAFEALETSVIPKLFEGLGAADSVRIWVPGCATGEEVYSLAILVREHLDKLNAAPRVQLFATDIDEAALAIARAGRYPHALIDNIKPDRLDRFFVRDDASYTIIKDVRDLCIFSSHSVIRDPPFSRIDMISCRNLLIYLGPEFQARVIPVFHFALRPGGYLFLGTSENISQYSNLFQSIDKKQRLFQRRDHVTSSLQFPLFVPGTRNPMPSVEYRREQTSLTNLRRVVEGRVLENFSPPHVVVNREGDIVHYSPRTGKYLEAATGMPSRQLFAAARRGLRLDLRSAFQEAMESRRQAIREDVIVEIDDRIQSIRLTVEPLGNHETDPLFLVIFTDVGVPRSPAEATARRVGQSELPAEQLENELRETRERLQASVEEYETALEELKAANEEMVSINEELQSTNEELETSKEELQSVNEELNTVNSELNSKVDELDRANTDLRNLFESTEVATVFLDRGLVIRSFTPAVTSIFNLISTDRGRPLTDIVSSIHYEDVQRDIRVVLERGETIERQVSRTDGGTHYLMRMLAYRGRHNVIEGVVVTFFNITKLVEGEAQQRTLVEELNHRVRNMLTIVGAMANRTLANTETPQAFVEAFNTRIRAMAATYSLVSREQWGEVSLAEIFATALEPHIEDHDRVEVTGNPVMIMPAGALALGLIAHELATNAVKYGALATDKGRLAVSWGKEDGRLVIQWRETNGRKGTRPTKKGFGTELMDRELKTILKGSINRDYTADGLQAVLSLPIEPDGIINLSE